MSLLCNDPYYGRVGDAVGFLKGWGTQKRAVCCRVVAGSAFEWSA